MAKVGISFVIFSLFINPLGLAQEEKLTLVKAEICEDLRQNQCVFPSRIVSVSVGKVYCYSSFIGIPKIINIYHKWYQRDQLIATFVLKLRPPSYATTSSIQLRDSDKGPWKVEIVDQAGRVYSTLRFSVVD
jgi:hypothetical protein